MIGVRVEVNSQSWPIIGYTRYGISYEVLKTKLIVSTTLAFGSFPHYLGTRNRSVSVIMSNHYCTSMRLGHAFVCCWCWSTLPLDYQQQISDNLRLRKFNTSLPRSRFCGEKHRVTRQKETILKQGVSRMHRNNFEYTNFIMIWLDVTVTAKCLPLQWTIIGWGFCNIHNDEGRGKCCQLSRSLRLIIAHITKTESNIVLLYIVLK